MRKLANSRRAQAELFPEHVELFGYDPALVTAPRPAAPLREGGDLCNSMPAMGLQTVRIPQWSSR